MHFLFSPLGLEPQKPSSEEKTLSAQAFLKTQKRSTYDFGNLQLSACMLVNLILSLFIG